MSRSQNFNTLPSQQQQAALPNGWEMYIDEVSKCPYFVDHNTKNTTWQDPRQTMYYSSYPPAYPPQQQQQQASYPYSGYPQQHAYGGEYDRKDSIEIPVQHEGFPRQPQPQFNMNHVKMEHGASLGPREIPIQHTDQPSRQDRASHSTPFTHNIKMERRDTGSRSPLPSTHSFDRNDRGSRSSPVSMFDRQDRTSRNSPVPQGSRNSPVSHGYQPNVPQGYSERDFQPNVSQGHQPPGSQGYSDRYPPTVSQGFQPNVSQGYSDQGFRASSRNSPDLQHDSHPGAPRSDTGSSRVIPIIHETRSQPSRPEDGHHSSPKPTESRKQEQPRPASMETEIDSEPPRKPQKPKSKEEIANELITKVVNEVRELENEVNKFTGVKSSKDYKLIEEMLTRSLIKLDSVETEGREEIRQRRKQTVRFIQQTLDMLELKASSNEEPGIPAGTQPTQSGPASSAGKNCDKDTDANVKEMLLDSEVTC